MENSAKKPLSRRTFLKASTLIATGAAITFGAISVPLLRSERRLLRPPGALAEDHFLSSCIKCGQCLQVCPPQVIHLAGISQGFGIGTPYITPREGGCILCSGLPCVLACPTGALDHHLSLGKDAEMGLAVLTRPGTCLSVLGENDLVHRLKQLQRVKGKVIGSSELDDILDGLVKRLTGEEKAKLLDHFSLPGGSEQIMSQLTGKIREADLQWLTEFVSGSAQARHSCRVCLDDCPIRDEKTIVFETGTNPKTGRETLIPTVQKSCVGCGVCEEKCPTTVASIIISPQLQWADRKTARQDHNRTS